MTLSPPYPTLDEIIASIGEAGQRLVELKAAEGAAGNISVYVGWQVEVRERFPVEEQIELPVPAPALAGKLIVVTGSGRRLRDLAANPYANLAAVVINPDGKTAQLYTSPQRLFKRITSEFNSHLSSHNDAVARTNTNFHALVHAQPTYLVYLSHVPAYRDQNYLNQKLIRWEPETIAQLPNGIGVLPFMLPGSSALMEATTVALREHNIVTWSKHGVMSSSDESVLHAVDTIEYAETGAHYEYLDLANSSRADGLSQEELREVARVFNVKTDLIP